MSERTAGQVVLDEATSEKDFQLAVRQYARLRHWLHYCTFDSRRSVAGFPDLVLLRPPRLVFVELKSEHGRLTDAQENWLDYLRGVPGVEAFCWRPHDWDAIEECLR